jgi:diketogulonate reductase-like aldo/keto reductase
MPAVGLRSVRIAVSERLPYAGLPDDLESRQSPALDARCEASAERRAVGRRKVSVSPRFVYGTAWKEERTESLTRTALDAGFRAIDTANQRKHYFEAAVGRAVASFLRDTGGTRESLFLQTKFTYARGQDHRLPYDPKADPETQVTQSLTSSLEHLGTTYVDSYLLHGPSTGRGLTDTDWTVWRTFETLHLGGSARSLGVSNVSREQLELLVKGARVAPAFVQNRCYASTGWDRGVREVCRANGIAYQGFSLLTANGRELASPAVERAAQRTGRTPAEVVFRFALEVGMVPLTGTSRLEHMKRDLACAEWSLTPDEVSAIDRLAR